MLSSINYSASLVFSVRTTAGNTNGEHCVCEIQAALGASQSRLSFHLKVLRDAGLVNDRRAGRWVHYSLRPPVLEEIVTFVQEHVPDAAAGSPSSCGTGRDVAACR